MWELLRVIYIALGVGVSVYLIRVVLKSKRRLDRRVSEFLEEQAESQGPPPDPYLALAELYAEEERRRRKPRKRTK
jgi:hypothetical protein